MRELFRHYREWRVLYENERIDEISSPQGSYSLWDIEYLLQQVHRLPPRQRDTILLGLVGGMREVDMAVMFGLSPTNPVLSYATTGLERIVGWVRNGELPRFQEGQWMEQTLAGAG